MTAFLAALALYAAGGAAALATAAKPRLALRLGAAGAAAGGALGTWAALCALLSGPAPALELPWSLPLGALRLAADPLSAAFLVPIFALSGLFAVYGVGYLDAWAGKKWLGGQAFFYNLLSISMALVVLARDGVLFLAAWEVMSLASFFLVAFEHERPDVREAARTYLIAMHLGAFFLFGFFLLLARETGSTALEPVGPGALAAGTAAGLFALALVGFGTKAGLWPLHVWLPKAHPAAPSHVSALMSAVMIKTGLYGLCRTLWLLGGARPSWALALLAVGAASGMLGILFALVQRDLKALLAYSSAENAGIIALGLGIGAAGSALGQPLVAAAGYAGALLHVWNHGLFKGLLFLGAGSVLHAAHTGEIDRLGGLAGRMPWTGGAFLVGAAAIAGLPPLNGLASEWLLYGALFRAGTALDGVWGLAPLAAAAALALMGGLALAAFAKAAGAVFLGEPRTAQAAAAHEGGWLLKGPLVLLAALCLAAGLAPAALAGALGRAVAVLDPAAGAALGQAAGWTAPLARVGLASALLLALGGALLGLRRALLSGRAVAASPTWDCGYAAPTARMQYTGSSFAAPAGEVFDGVLRSTVVFDAPEGFFPRTGRYESRGDDAAEAHLWRPVFAGAGGALDRLRFLQGGRLQHYLLFLLLALVALLAWALVPA